MAGDRMLAMQDAARCRSLHPPPRADDMRARSRRAAGLPEVQGGREAPGCRAAPACAAPAASRRWTSNVVAPVIARDPCCFCCVVDFDRLRFLPGASALSRMRLQMWPRLPKPRRALIEVTEGPGSGLKILNQSPPGPLKESVRCAEQNLYARSKEL